MNVGTIQQNIERIRNIADEDDFKLFEPYIRYIRFPQYKHLKKNERIDFHFPLTVLVGANGCNKSSVLQALFGCPQNKSVGSYWFSTDVDKIDKDSRHCLIYGYMNLHRHQIVEVLKTRIQKADNPDYWEPARPQQEYGMEPMPPMGEDEEGRSQTRWNAINKDVLYLDFRQNLPAYDKFFYHTPLKRTETIKSKQDYIRRFSKHLNSVIVGRLPEYLYYKKNKVHENKVLSPEKCEIISGILGKQYTSIQVVTHSFYGDQFAKTVVVSECNLKYSEAFAGSGESSIIILVDEIMDAKKNSLILLDEPETSLHPAAQKRLMVFLTKQVMSNKHQMVISTHSSFFLHHLPACAIKVLSTTTEGIQILPESLPEEAFNAIGSTDAIKKVFVEDALVKTLIESYIDRFHPQLKNSIEIGIASGGASTIITRYIYVFAQAQNTDVAFLLDGDKNYLAMEAKDSSARRKILDYKDSNGMFDASRIPTSDNGILESVIHEITRENIKFYVNGNKGVANSVELAQQQRVFLEYWFSRVHFLPGLIPEDEIIMSLNDSFRNELCGKTDFKTGSGKAVFEEYTKKDLAKKDVDSSEILMTQKRFIAKLDCECALFKSIEEIIRKLYPPSGA